MCFNLILRIFVLFEKWFIGRENYGKENVFALDWQALETPEPACKVPVRVLTALWSRPRRQWATFSVPASGRFDGDITETADESLRSKFCNLPYRR